MEKHNFDGISILMNAKINERIERLNSLKIRGLVTSKENQYSYLTFLQGLNLPKGKVFDIYTNTTLQ